MSNSVSDDRLARRARTEELRDQAVAILKDKTPEELVEYFVELSSLDLISHDGVGMAFTEACEELVEADPNRMLAYGLLLARHSLPTAREYAYWVLVPIQATYPEAREKILDLMDDPDESVARSYCERIEEDLEEPKGTFPEIMTRIHRLNAAKKRFKK